MGRGKGQISQLFLQGGRKPLSQEFQYHLTQQLTPEPVGDPRGRWETSGASGASGRPQGPVGDSVEVDQDWQHIAGPQCSYLDFLEIYICGQNPDCA